MRPEDGRMTEEQLQQRMQQLRSCQTLTTIALIGAPVSLLVGGVALSTAALVCAIVAFVRMRRLVDPDDVPGSVGRTLYVQSVVALVASCVALGFNAVAFVFMFGALLEAMQSGDASALFDSFGSAPREAPSSGKSIWD